MLDNKELIKEYLYHTYEGEDQISYKIDSAKQVKNEVWVVYTYTTTVDGIDLEVDENLAKISLFNLITFVYRAVF